MGVGLNPKTLLNTPMLTGLHVLPVVELQENK